MVGRGIQQFALLGTSEHLERLSKYDDPLKTMYAIVDFESAEPWLVEALGDGDGARGGWPRFQPVPLIKLLILRTQHKFRDAKMEFRI